jgi:hypothetical protein
MAKAFSLPLLTGALLLTIAGQPSRAAEPAVLDAIAAADAMDPTSRERSSRSRPIRLGFG